MKILVLADLHRSVARPEQNTEQDEWIAGLLQQEKPDLVVIAGDIFPPTHAVNQDNPYNAYGGITWLLDEIQPEYAICGHSHLPVHDVKINSTRCWNVGNDYAPPFRHVSIEI